VQALGSRAQAARFRKQAYQLELSEPQAVESSL